MTSLAEWANFYVSVGSSAGALIGLQFVVITLIANMPITRDLARASSAFATPTVVHFTSVLVLAAIVCAPWHGITAAAACWGLLGLLGLVYEIIVARWVRAQTAYTPEFEDLLFHLILPSLAYGTLAAAWYAVRRDLRGALLAVGAAALVLLLVGIHNAWDAVTYHIITHKGGQDAGSPER
ncbi:MAG: hypothetical protein JOZ80_15330 [Acidobacteriaceae bacterium]|nr:hypothetical protein [Acidobacteriaceae bacterium]